MKKLFFTLFSVVALFAAGCSEPYGDTPPSEPIDNSGSKDAQIEELCQQINTNISVLQTIIEVLQNDDYVTNITHITDGDHTLGYTISFSVCDSITIYYVQDGTTDGKDGYIPRIGVKADADDFYYWTLDGEWLLDDKGEKIKAQGTGADGNTPKLKIENDYWYVSYDNGITWIEVGKATGGDGNSMFKEVTYDVYYVYITLADGTVLVLLRSAYFADVPTNEIWYTSTDGVVVTPYDEEVFGANVVSNEYENGKGIIKFDGEVTSIGLQAFMDCESLTSITIPDSVTSIGGFAFYYCKKMTSIIIPNNVTSIGDAAFFVCESLTSITLPNSVTSIGYFAFLYCKSLTSITIPDSVTSIGRNPFDNCFSLASFYGKYASADNRCLIVDGEVKSFAPAGLTSYTIPSGVISIGDRVFNECYFLTSITIPDSVTSIGDEAFGNCDGLIGITIPDSVTSIGTQAFWDSDSLTSITIPESVTSIGNLVFAYCDSLTTVFSKNPIPPLAGDDMFYDCHSQPKIYVPASCVDAYKGAEGWSTYASMIEGYDFQ